MRGGSARELPCRPWDPHRQICSDATDSVFTWKCSFGSTSWRPTSVPMQNPGPLRRGASAAVARLTQERTPSDAPYPGASVRIVRFRFPDRRCAKTRSARMGRAATSKHEGYGTRVVRRVFWQRWVGRAQNERLGWDRDCWVNPHICCTLQRTSLCLGPRSYGAPARDQVSRMGGLTS